MHFRVPGDAYLHAAVPTYPALPGEKSETEEGGGSGERLRTNTSQEAADGPLSLRGLGFLPSPHLYLPFLTLVAPGGLGVRAEVRLPGLTDSLPTESLRRRNTSELSSSYAWGDVEMVGRREG